MLFSLSSFLLVRPRVCCHMCCFSACVSCCVFSSTLCIDMSASPVHILVFLLHFPLIPCVVLVVRMYGSSFLALLLLFRFPLRFLSFLVFLGWRFFPYVCTYKFLISSQVNWRFEGTAAVVALVFTGFLKARIFAFWVSFGAVELSYLRSEGPADVEACISPFSFRWRFFLLGEFLTSSPRGVFEREFGHLLPVFSVQFHCFMRFWAFCYVFGKFYLCCCLGIWVVSLFLCFVYLCLFVIEWHDLVASAVDVV